MVNRESPRPTKLYDHTHDAISLDERASPAVPGIERIMIQTGNSVWQVRSNECEVQKPKCPRTSPISVAGR